METAANFFDDLLPPEVTTEIFSYFSLEDVVYVSLVCKGWNLYFDTKEIWKQIFALHFGEIDPKRLDISQILKWRRVCINGLNAKNWSKNFLKTTTTCYYQFTTGYSRESIQVNTLTNKHHIFVMGPIISLVDIKMAGKLKPVKSNPVQFFSPLQYNRNPTHQPERDFKYKYDKSYEAKANKEDSYKISPELSEIQHTRVFSINDESGRILSLLPEGEAVIWDYTNHNTTNKLPYAVEALPLLTHRSQESLNSRYLSFIFDAKNGDFYTLAPENRYGVLDLTKKCTHYQKLVNKNNAGKWELEITTLHSPCRIDTCAWVNKKGDCLTTFASKLDPAVVVFFLPDKIDVWKSGKSVKEIPYEVGDKKKVFQAPMIAPRTRLHFGQQVLQQVTPIVPTEHVTNVHGVSRHWLQFTMDNKNIAIVDLNDIENRIVLPEIAKFGWVPKENKVALVSDNKIAIFDLDRRSWSVKLLFQKPIQAITFNTSGNILFAADNFSIHMVYWRGGIILGSIETELERVTSLQLALDQVLVLVAMNYVLYKRMPYPCTL